MALDADDITRLYQRHSRDMVRFFARRTYDPEAALDLMAETFACAVRDQRSFRGSTDEEAVGWLYGIARHQLASFYRRGEVEKRVMSQLGIERRELSDPELERVQELAELDELRGRVAQELANLPADQAYLLRLRIVEQLEYSQLAAELHVSEQATRQRVSRALKALTQRLDLDARSEERQR